MRFETICTWSNDPEYLGLWRGLDSREAIEFTAKRDDWRSIFDDSAPTYDELTAMDVGDIWEFDDMDGNRFVVVKKG